MKSLVFASIALLGFAGPAAADFSGPVGPALWTVTNTGTLIGGSPTLGSASFTTTQLMLTGSNSLSPSGDSPSCTGGFFQTLGPCQLQVTRNLPGTYAFSWSYLSSDAAGPGGDLFGVIVDSNRIQLSDPGGANAQSGTRTFAANSSFGWFINCTDCIGGSATSTISQFAFAAAVPEPETYALMVAGVLGLIARLKRHRRPGSLGGA
jgi:PEP-CTERM motif-containing protein